MKKNLTPNKPKRPVSGYIRFTSELRKQDPELKKMSVGEASNYFSKKWAELSQEEKQRLSDEYNEEMVSYNEAFAKYKLTDEYKSSLKKGKKEKKKVSPYNVFMAESYERKKKEGSCEFKEVAKEASQLWNKLSEEDKEKFKKKADEVNEARKEKENKI
ncbi:High mobility HMG1 High mobility superfamily protein [Tubulinosema ratisbonensis]|uniref:High mobility HMG1 High mobility superfamily protein n=1 Tax=Tubulinosema ratisbonensis TaxID=291195 RepID=A0A437ALV8_9MICR|nr:High mobility HMG1 High mobility superfamily protein [Tubulinosema ratisbonensis]